MLPIAQYIDETFNKVTLTLKSEQVNTTNLEKVLQGLKKNIVNSETKESKSLEICIDLDDVKANFDSFNKAFSVYEFVNSISRLIAEGSTVGLSG